MLSNVTFGYHFYSLVILIKFLVVIIIFWLDIDENQGKGI